MGAGGVAFASGWLTPSTGAIQGLYWNFMCTSLQSSNAARAFANGFDISIASASGGILSGLSGPSQITINTGVASTIQSSNFGVLELVTWNRALSASELYQVKIAQSSPLMTFHPA